MKVMLVDDEPLALMVLEKNLLQIGGMDIVGKYNNPTEALHAAKVLQPDVAFLDINLPVISGIDLAEGLFNSLPNLNVVFVTAYDMHAIKAFELNAIDYLLKPVHPERLKTTINRLLISVQLSQSVSETHTIVESNDSTMLRCLSYLQFEQQHPIQLTWRTAKAQELLAYLIHWRRKPIKKDTLLELLWPDTDLKKGLTQLYSAIYQIRKLLEMNNLHLVIQSVDKGYMLDLQDVKLDVDMWQEGLQAAELLSLSTLETHKQLLELYRGDYLNDHCYIWAESEKERLRAIWFQHAIQVANFMTESQLLADAITLYYRLQQAFPDREEIYLALMKIYYVQNDYALMKKQYSTLCAILSEEYDAEPSAAITQWYNQNMVR